MSDVRFHPISSRSPRQRRSSASGQEATCAKDSVTSRSISRHCQCLAQFLYVGHYSITHEAHVLYRTVGALL